MNINRRSVVFGAAVTAGGVGVGAYSQGPFVFGLLLDPQPRGRRTRVVSVRDFGAHGNGQSDDRVAIQAAIESVARSGGGTVLFPAGTYLVSRSGRSAVAISLKSNITLQGEGTPSVLKLQDGSGGHLVNVTRETNCAIRKMVLDGNRLRQDSVGHVFRSGGVTGLLLEDLEIRNAFHYGIGLEAGTNRGVTISKVVIHECGGDGIDIKNKNNNNSIVRIVDVTVRRWGLRPGTDSQAGIDCRGPVRLKGIRISDPGSVDAVGVRMRQGELRDANGLGAHHSQMDDFDVRMGGGQKRIGINVVVRDVTLSNGTISNGFRGLVVQDSNFRGSRISVRNCSETGILINAGESGLTADAAILSNCTITACGGDGIGIEANNVQILDCVSSANGRHGLAIKQSANATRIIRGNYAKNRAGRIENHGRSSSIVTVAA